MKFGIDKRIIKNRKNGVKSHFYGIKLEEEIVIVGVEEENNDSFIKKIYEHRILAG